MPDDAGFRTGYARAHSPQYLDDGALRPGASKAHRMGQPGVCAQDGFGAILLCGLPGENLLFLVSFVDICIYYSCATSSLFAGDNGYTGHFYHDDCRVYYEAKDVVLILCSRQSCTKARRRSERRVVNHKQSRTDGGIYLYRCLFEWKIRACFFAHLY